MSWMKRAQDGAGAGAGPQPYATPQAQPFTNQQNMYPNYPGGTGNPPQQASQQPQYWQVPPAGPAVQQQFNQQYAQVYQQEYPPNANQLYQQPPQYNHNYTNHPGYANPQQSYQQNHYQNQPPQQNYPQNTGNSEGWEDNWDWGWEESAKKAQKAQNTAQQQPVQQEQVFSNSNNANVIEESFASTNTWNWAMDDKKGPKEPVDLPPKQETNASATLPIENNTTPEPNILSSVNNSTPTPNEEVRTLSDREVVKERMPNLALGKRFHVDNLTPQWSIESQMSQESSDGPQTHSESTYRSENQSRNSNSPGPNTDNSNFNYSHSGLNDGYTQNSEWSRESDEPTLADSAHAGSRRDSQDELSYSMQDLNLVNIENLSSQNNVQVNPIHNNSQLNVACVQPITASLPPLTSGIHPSPPSMSMPPPSMSMPPPPPLSSTTSPAPPVTPPVRAPSASLPSTLAPLSAAPLGPQPPSTASQPPPPTASASLPTPNFTLPSNSQNPFKHTGPFAHKSKAPSVPEGFPTQISSAHLASPAVVHKISQQSRSPVGFEANLETTPENSERPDHPHAAAFRPAPAPHPFPDNMEVAPRSDRNEYLQTAHLSSGDYGENTDFSRGAPPPGLRRMGVGQQESEYGRGPNVSGDEPPLGLARMVPGQQTEGDSAYEQPGDDYMERLIDGRPTDGGARPYRRADGQRAPDEYAPPPASRAARPVGFDRMVPGEPSNDEYLPYQGSVFPSGNEQRVVTGLEREFLPRGDAPPSDAREQNVDGSDYTERAPRPLEAPPDELRRDGTMEGENLQDLSAVSSAELAYSRDNTLEMAADSVSPERPVASSRRASPSRRSSDDTDRDRAFQASPRRDRRKTSRDADRDRDEDDRYARGERKYDRDDRKSTRDDRRSDRDRRDRRDRDRRDRDESPDARRKRRSTRSHRYETEDTDYYSDKERDRRRHREGSYASRPPRPDDREHDRRYDERSSRARRYGAERGDGRDARRERTERPERAYRDIDPSRKYGNRRRERDEEERRRVTFSCDAKAYDNSRSEGSQLSSPSRAGSRDGATDEDAPHARRRDPRARRTRRDHDAYYDGYGAAAYNDPYLAQRAQYEYYEQLRRSDPAAYMQVYKRLMAARADPRRAPPDLLDGYGSLGYEARDEHGSVHSGRSSATGLKGNDTDLGTELSLPTLDTSTVRSERMTPHRFSTAHVKASIASRHIVVVRPSYPVDGLPATVQLLALPAALAAGSAAGPGPLVKGVTHKKSVIEYCNGRAAAARREAACDALGAVLLWELLALLLRQNGVVVGSDIAELLMKNTREYEYKTTTNKSIRNESRRASSVSSSAEPPPAAPAPDDASSESLSSPVDERAALDKLREYLVYGNRQDALEWAMNNNLWGHALQLAAYSERRTRGAVAARFLSATPRRDPLHTLYASLAAATPPAATCVADENWGDWRPHAAIVLANSGARRDHDTRTLTMLGDSLASRGLLYSAQFCYVSGGVGFARHPLAPLAPPPAPAAPPRLSLLLADGRATRLDQFATDRAILATEIYEYALSLNRDYVIPELQVYKLVLATRLVDAGLYERALAYVEQAARAAAASPRDYSPRLLASLAELADRLKYHDPALHEDSPLAEEGAEGSPRHQQWLDDVKHVAHMLQVESASQHATPQHHVDYYAQQQHEQQHQQQYSWDQAHQYQQQQQQELTPPARPHPEPEETAADNVAQYYPPAAPPAPPAEPEVPPQYYEDWRRTEEHHAQAYAEPSYWRGDQPYGYGEAEGAAPGDNPRPMITMPGAAHRRHYDDDRPPSAEQQNERDVDTGTPTRQDGKAREPGKGEDKGDGKGKGSGWFGGIFSKLSLRPPQANLPDDKNPRIVWNEETKRWKNLDEDETDADQPPPPPPKMADIAAQMQHQQQQSTGSAGAPQAAPPPVSNIFKMQKGRHIKKSYVDVFNPGGAARPLPPAAAVLGAAPALQPAPTYFVPPAPVSTVSLPPRSPRPLPPAAAVLGAAPALQPAPTYFVPPAPVSTVSLPPRSPRPLPPAAAVLGAAPALQPAPTYFVPPAPVSTVSLPPRSPRPLPPAAAVLGAAPALQPAPTYFVPPAPVSTVSLPPRSPRPLPPAAAVLGAAPALQPAPTYFVPPAPVSTVSLPPRSPRPLPPAAAVLGAAPALQPAPTYFVPPAPVSTVSLPPRSPRPLPPAAAVLGAAPALQPAPTYFVPPAPVSTVSLPPRSPRPLPPAAAVLGAAPALQPAPTYFVPPAPVSTVSLPPRSPRPLPPAAAVLGAAPALQPAPTYFVPPAPVSTVSLPPRSPRPLPPAAAVLGAAPALQPAPTYFVPPAPVSTVSLPPRSPRPLPPAAAVLGAAPALQPAPTYFVPPAPVSTVSLPPRSPRPLPPAAAVLGAAPALQPAPTYFVPPAPVSTVSLPPRSPRPLPPAAAVLGAAPALQPAPTYFVPPAPVSTVSLPPRSPRPLPPAAAVLGAAPALQPAPTYFVPPAPVSTVSLPPRSPRPLPPAAAVLGAAPALQPAPTYFVPPAPSGGYEYELGDGQLRSGI